MNIECSSHEQPASQQPANNSTCCNAQEYLLLSGTGVLVNNGHNSKPWGAQKGGAAVAVPTGTSITHWICVIRRGRCGAQSTAPAAYMISTLPPDQLGHYQLCPLQRRRTKSGPLRAKPLAPIAAVPLQARACGALLDQARQSMFQWGFNLAFKD